MRPLLGGLTAAMPFELKDLATSRIERTSNAAGPNDDRAKNERYIMTGIVVCVDCFVDAFCLKVM